MPGGFDECFELLVCSSCWCVRVEKLRSFMLAVEVYPKVFLLFLFLLWPF